MSQNVWDIQLQLFSMSKVLWYIQLPCFKMSVTALDIQSELCV